MTETYDRPRCIWKGTEHPRALKGRHEDGCVDDECRGCFPCPESHCIICGIEHVHQRTCPGCVATVRQEINALPALYAQLPDQAVYGGHDGKLEAARPIPGGEAMYLLGPGSKGGAVAWAKERGEDVSHREDERAGEIEPTEMWAVGWEDDWRKIRHQPTDQRAELGAAVDYLDEHLAWAAQYHDAFDAFAEEARQQVARLEDVLHEGDREAKPPPCFYCGGKIERRTHPRYGLLDEWDCKGTCGRHFKLDQYNQLVKAAYIANADKLTASDAAIKLGISATRIRVWGSRDKSLKAGRDESGLWLYKVSALEARMEEAKEDVRDAG